MWNIYVTYFLVAFSIAQAAVFQKSPINDKKTVISKYEGSLPLDKLKNKVSVEIRDSTIEDDESLEVSFPELKSLSIQSSKIPDDVFQAFPNLERLELLYSEIENFKLEDLNDFPKLKVLIIHGQKLNRVEENAFDQLKDLKQLRLTAADLNTLDEDALNGLDNLEVLDLSWNNLKTIEKKTLEPVKKLRKLVLGYNEIEKFGPENIPVLPELELIDLGVNPISSEDIDLEGISELAPRTHITLVG